MRSSRFTALVIGAVFVAGCSDDPDVVVTPDSPKAVVRFINAVPDTLGSDWRFIDQVTLSPVELGLGFRGIGPYQAAAPGARPLRVFPATSDLSTQNFFIDQTINLEANKRYTLAHIGMSREGQTPADQLIIVEDVLPASIPDGQIAARAGHLGAGIGNVDIYVSKAGGSTALGTPTWTNVAYGTVTPYQMFTAGPKTNVTGIGSTRGGYFRTTGSFAADGFTVGQQIFATSFSPAANTGRTIVTGIVSPKTTGSATIAVIPTGFVRTGGSFIADGFAAGMPVTSSGFTNPDNNGTFFVTRVTADSLLVGTTTGGTTIRVTSTQYIRTDTLTGGSFLEQGFHVGQTIQASGFTNSANNGNSVISNVTATVITVAPRTPSLVTEAAPATGTRTLSNFPALVPEAAAPGRTIVSHEILTVNRTSQVPALPTGTQTLVGELVYRATLTGSTTVIAEWMSYTGLPGDPILGQEPIGGNTMAGSAIIGFLMPRSVAGSTATQTPPTTVPATPPFNAPTFIFAIDKHPR